MTLNLPIRFLRKGQPCPEWLQKIEFSEPGLDPIVGWPWIATAAAVCGFLLGK